MSLVNSQDYTALVRDRNRRQSDRFLKALQRHHGLHVASISADSVEAPPEIIIPIATPVEDKAFDDAWKMIENENRSGPIRKIQRIVAEEFGITRAELISIRRKAKLVEPRQVAMYLCRSLAERSYPDIGRRFGGRDHTTVIHAVRKVAERIGKDEAFAARMSLIQRRTMEQIAS